MSADIPLSASDFAGALAEDRALTTVSQVSISRFRESSSSVEAVINASMALEDSGVAG